MFFNAGQIRKVFFDQLFSTKQLDTKFSVCLILNTNGNSSYNTVHQLKSIQRSIIM